MKTCAQCGPVHKDCVVCGETYADDAFTVSIEGDSIVLSFVR